MSYATFVTRFVQAKIYRQAEKVYELASRTWQAWEMDTIRVHVVDDSKCQKNIICECQRRCCPGRTLSIVTYVRRIKQS